MAKTKLLLGSNNAHKAEEIAALLEGLEVELLTPRQLNLTEEPVEDGKSFAANAAIKARFYQEKSGLPALADDSGLVVDALDGRPGIYSSRYAPTDKERIAKLLEELADTPEDARTSRFVCVAALALPDGRLFQEEGLCEGRIAFAAKGNHGFGYDPVFLIPSQERTMAELEEAEKNRLSHRGQAMKKMGERLLEIFPKR